jgi:hypothetical protein
MNIYKYIGPFYNPPYMNPVLIMGGDSEYNVANVAKRYFTDNPDGDLETYHQKEYFIKSLSNPENWNEIKSNLIIFDDGDY